jgi:hypothetical protein
MAAIVLVAFNVPMVKGFCCIKRSAALFGLAALRLLWATACAFWAERVVFHFCSHYL